MSMDFNPWTLIVHLELEEQEGKKFQNLARAQAK